MMKRLSAVTLCVLTSSAFAATSTERFGDDLINDCGSSWSNSCELGWWTAYGADDSLSVCRSESETNWGIGIEGGGFPRGFHQIVTLSTGATSIEWSASYEIISGSGQIRLRIVQRDIYRGQLRDGHYRILSRAPNVR